MDRAVVIGYDSSWPAQFEAERVVLEGVLAEWLEGGIHHVGSTAVPGLAAKPIIDILAGVQDLGEAVGALEPLAALGYQHHVHRPEAHAFFKPRASRGWRERTHQLHLTEQGSDLWVERLGFRDALRSDALVAAEYEAWKVRHACGDDELNPYAVGKTDFVTRVLATRGITLRADSERLTINS